MTSPTPAAVTLSPRGLRLGEDELPLFSGALHYFRTPPSRWGKCLAAIRGLGFPLVESYVPWGVHERRRGQFDFQGPRDLGAFLDAAAGEGLRVILRPGPHINAELACFGFPERIVADPRLLQRTSRGTPATLLVPPRGFPVPSYASRAFLDEVRSWFAAVAEVVAPRLFPRGPVVALQVDNEHAYFFRSGAYDADYHDEALARWSEESPGQEAPRRFRATTPEELAPHLAWLGFRERQIGRALATLGGLLDEVGLGGVVRTHNFPPNEPLVFDVAATERVLDVAGIDLYHSRRQYAAVRRRALYLAGSSRLPYVPEMGTGSFPWGPPLDGDDAVAQLLTCLMHGVVAWNAYMLVERDRWYGAPIAADGTVRPLGDRLRRILAALDGAGWGGLSRRAPVGVIVPRSYGRLAVAASHAGPIGPAFTEFLGLDASLLAREQSFGLAGPVQIEHADLAATLLAALDRAHVPYVIVDGSVDAARLSRLAAVFAITLDFLEVDLAARLRAFAAGGGQLFHGPRRPSRDEAMQPLAADLPGRFVDGASFADEAALGQLIAELAAAAGPSPLAVAEPTVDATLHQRPGGEPGLLFVANRSADATTATVTLPGAAAVEDALDGATFAGATLSIPLAPHGVRMLRVG